MTQMNTNEAKVLYPELSYKIVGCAMEVHRQLGFGFLEKVYENALMVVFQRERISAKQQEPIKVYFEGVEVGYYEVDILVEDKIILELKAVDRLIDAHRAQALNYLKATGFRLAILLNFGKQKLEYERLVY
jgi:GxxExxY protein